MKKYMVMELIGDGVYTPTRFFDSFSQAADYAYMVCNYLFRDCNIFALINNDYIKIDEVKRYEKSN